MSSMYYQTIGEREPFIPLDPSTTWVLFVLTLILEGITFWCLEYCSNIFRDFVVMSATDGRGTHEALLQPVVVQTTLPGSRSLLVMNPCNSIQSQPGLRSTHANINYQNFHDTLDVSIFR